MSTRPHDTTRRYRSAKRPHPCDQCRGRKLKCLMHGEPPCERCQRDGGSCSFSQRLSKRRQAQSVTLHPSISPEHNLEHPSQQTVLPSTRHDTSIDPTADQVYNDSVPFQHHEANVENSAMGSPRAALITDPFLLRPITQLSRSFEKDEGSTALFLGTSSSSDPWLLRHSRFDQFGLCSFNSLQFRNAGGVPTAEKIPVHFLMSASDRPEEFSNETGIFEEDFDRVRVNSIVSIAQGTRLIRLYVLNPCDVLFIAWYRGQSMNK